MKMISKILLSVLFFFSTFVSFGQKTTITGDTISLETPNAKIYGTLRNPSNSSKVPVVLIIAGSGPTDRNGNNPQMQNNSLKFLAESLYQRGIASLTYDKRAIGSSKMKDNDESKLTFDLYVGDANKWIEMLKEDNHFSDITIVGHSEGGLIGLVVANENRNVDKLVLIATSSQNYGDLIMTQLKDNKYPEEQINLINSYVEKLKGGQQIDNVNPEWYPIFRPSVQPFLISAMKYEPTDLIKSIVIPILIIQGTTDIQVSLDNAENLSKANLKAHKVVIEKMNHVLKECDSLDQQAQIATYLNPDLPIKSQLVTEISEFVK